MKKFTFIITAIAMMVLPLIGWGQTYQNVATFESSTVVNGTKYQTYSTNDWNLTFGGNNVSMGTNKNSAGNCRISTDYGTSASTSNIATAAISENALANVSRITFVHTAGSGNSGSIYFAYSTDKSTWNAINLTSGTQGASTPAVNTTMTVTFNEISSAYYAVILDKGNATAANFRFDNVTITFDKVNSGPATPTHSLTFSANPAAGGTVKVNNSTESPATVEEDATVNILATANAGYVFNGWELTSGEGSFGDASLASTTFTMGTTDATIRANFAEQQTYTVTYHANVTGIADQTVSVDQGANHAVKPANTFANAGNGFTQWTTAQDGTGDAYYQGTSITDIQDDIDLWAQWEEVNYDFRNITGFDGWGGYAAQTVTYSDATVYFESASHQGTGQPITDQPVTKGSYVTLKLTEQGATMSSAKFYFTQWTTKTQTITLSYSTDGGTTYSGTTPATTSTNFVISNANLPTGTNAVKITFSSTSNQIGIAGAKITKIASTNPSLAAEDVDLEYNDEDGSISYTLNNPQTGGAVTAAITAGNTGNWLSIGDPSNSNASGTVALTCAANENTTERTATVTLTYTYGNNESVTKDVTVTQAAAPVIYSTIPALFAAATSTSTPVMVNFNGWVVTGVNGSQSFVTDGTNGFIMYQSNHGFVVGNTLSGTVSCNLVLFNGSAEITGLKTGTTGLTVGQNGVVTPVTTTIGDLGAVNTGSVVTLNNLTYNGTTLSDGTNTIEFYTSLYNETTLENGKTYNITGVFVLNNSDKRILPRSAADIAEVQVQHNEYTLTVSNLVHVNTYVFDASDQTNPLLTGAGNVNIYDGTEVMISVDVDQDYVISSLIVDGSDVTSQIEADAYTFTMPTHAVTVTATAVESVTPLTPTSTAYVRISALSQLTDGCKVVIAARYNDVNTNGYYAMTAATSGKPAGTAFTSTTSNNKEILPSNITNSIDTYYWTVNVTDDGYTFTNASNQVIGWSSSTSFTTGGNNTTWTITRETSDNDAMVGGYTGYVIRNGNSDTRAFALNGTPAFGPYSTQNMTGNECSGYNFCLDFFVYAETYTYTIEAYTVEQGTTGNPTDGWYLISSPVNWNITPTASTGFITTNTYDLYRFNQDGADGEWENWKEHGFMLANGKGYLYANSAGTTLTFTGAPVNGTTKTVDLDYIAGTEFAGVNLVGNPFPAGATSNMSYYVMNSARTGIEPNVKSAGTAIDPFTGVIVEATSAGQKVTFTKQSQSSTGSTNNGYVNLVLSQTVNRSNATLDKAIVSFNEGDQLGKFYFGSQDANLYFAMSDKDYAIATAEAQGEMPVNFKAAEDGQYTITVNAENVEMGYLHLIDNLTGANVDLLATPSYTFNGKTTDYASRFRLVFSANEANAENDNFAFVSNGQIILNGANNNATLQVIDMMGRIVSTQQVNGNNAHMAPVANGVYVLQLINGNEVKTQKIVVK